MAAAQNAIAVATHPGEWKKSTSPEEYLTSFEKYMRQFGRYMNVSGLNDFTNSQKWDLLISVGGGDMEDLIVFQEEVETREVAREPGHHASRESDQVPAILDGQDRAAARVLSSTPQKQERGAFTPLQYTWLKARPSLS